MTAEGPTGAPPTFDLRCPFCDDEMTPELEYTGTGYSEHRDHVGYECDGCDAYWDTRGRVSRWPSSYSVESSIRRQVERAERANEHV